MDKKAKIKKKGNLNEIKQVNKIKNLDKKAKIKKKGNLKINKKRNKNKNISVESPPKKNNQKDKELMHSNELFNNKHIKVRNNIIVFNNKKQKQFHNSEFEKINESKNSNKIYSHIDHTDNKKEELLDYYELNNLEYSEAKILDNRNFLIIYWSLLKREHSFIFTFITKDDYNITIIKYSRFIFLLCSDMAMNVFFFSDETMHKIFLDYGKYNFIQQIPQIIYSTIISKLLEILLCFLSMTDKYYYQIKDNKYINQKIVLSIIKCIKIKIAFFFIFTILIFCFYWYLIACFCAVYRNTQIAFIKDSLASFFLGNLLPFVIYLFPTLFRIISLKSNIFCSNCFYQFSNIIPCF